MANGGYTTEDIIRIELACKERGEEIARLRAEVARLTRERDEIRTGLISLRQAAHDSDLEACSPLIEVLDGLIESKGEVGQDYIADIDALRACVTQLVEALVSLRCLWGCWCASGGERLADHQPACTQARTALAAAEKLLG